MAFGLLFVFVFFFLNEVIARVGGGVVVVAWLEPVRNGYLKTLVDCSTELKRRLSTVSQRSSRRVKLCVRSWARQ